MQSPNQIHGLVQVTTIHLHKYTNKGKPQIEASFSQ